MAGQRDRSKHNTYQLMTVMSLTGEQIAVNWITSDLAWDLVGSVPGENRRGTMIGWYGVGVRVWVRVG